MELWRSGEREQLAVLGMISNRGKRQIRGVYMGRERWKQAFILNEEERQGCLGWERPGPESASGSGIVQQKQGRVSLEAGTACALGVLAGGSATRGAQLMGE